jgi:NAD(P)-dependent dehydrogenase (short-subunit alcohol dehydrogenase family)
VIFDDVNFTSRPYDPGLAYGQSKTANVLFAVEATRRWANDGITANAVQPGPVAATNLNRHLDADALAGVQASAPYAGTVDESNSLPIQRSEGISCVTDFWVSPACGSRRWRWAP